MEALRAVGRWLRVSSGLRIQLNQAGLCLQVADMQNVQTVAGSLR